MDFLKEQNVSYIEKSKAEVYNIHYVLRHHFMNISVDVAYIRILGYDANHRKNDFLCHFSKIGKCNMASFTGRLTNEVNRHLTKI